MERSLSPRQYQHRLPFFATVVSDQQARINGYTPAIMEQEIAFAKAGGLDYWAFLLYETNSPMSQALSLYLGSPRQNDVRFCAVAYTHTIQRESARIVGLMAKPNYVKVDGGRPLFFAFRVTQEWIRMWGGPEKAKALFDGIRSAAVAAGCGNPYLVAMNDSVSEGNTIAKLIGADAISAYAMPGDGGKNGTSYVGLMQVARRFWEKAAEAGTQVVPLAMAG